VSALADGAGRQAPPLRVRFPPAPPELSNPAELKAHFKVGWHRQLRCARVPSSPQHQISLGGLALQSMRFLTCSLSPTIYAGVGTRLHSEAQLTWEAVTRQSTPTEAYEPVALPLDRPPTQQRARTSVFPWGSEIGWSRAGEAPGTSNGLLASDVVVGPSEPVPGARTRGHRTARMANDARATLVSTAPYSAACAGTR
jgi:hypothetical protein